MTQTEHLPIYKSADDLSASNSVRTASKSLLYGEVLYPKQIGAQHGDPYSAFQDTLSSQNPKGFVYAIIAFHTGLDSAESIQAEYNKLASVYGEQKLLDTAKHMRDGYTLATGRIGKVNYS